jgi:hypothetical protein
VPALLPDTKRSEDAAEEVVRRNRAGHFAESVERRAQLSRDEVGAIDGIGHGVGEFSSAVDGLGAGGKAGPLACSQREGLILKATCRAAD